jgi:hypothetical protein
MANQQPQQNNTSFATNNNDITTKNTTNNTNFTHNTITHNHLRAKMSSTNPNAFILFRREWSYAGQVNTDVHVAEVTTSSVEEVKSWVCKINMNYVSFDAM